MAVSTSLPTEPQPLSKFRFQQLNELIKILPKKFIRAEFKFAKNASASTFGQQRNKRLLQTSMLFILKSFASFESESKNKVKAKIHYLILPSGPPTCLPIDDQQGNSTFMQSYQWMHYTIDNVLVNMSAFKIVHGSEI